ncbi:MAG: S8 family serine peptidase [Aquiluna sp.]|nr:S8 family serine peptidase [Aquiluna sp.]MCF8545377.1 S8 family serine peptidase [Aquiluna sp.]
MRLIAAVLASLLAATLPASSQWWLKEYGFDQAKYDGTGVTVAVIDTGIDAKHPDLIGTVVDGVDFSQVGNPSGTAPVGSSSFHGTMVASLIAGQGRTSGGVIGVAPGVKLLSISIGLGVTGSDTDAQIAKGVVWAVDHGADVINLSLSRNSAVWPKSWDEAFIYAFENDVVVVAASGNRSDGSARPSAPATMPQVISVGGVDKSGIASDTSSTQGLGLVLVAPAEELYGSYPGGEIRSWGGSSAAAPLVTGLVALMLQKDPTATSSDIALRLTSTVRDAGEPGFDAEYGFGIIDPTSALLATGKAAQSPLGSLSNWVELYRETQAEEKQEGLIPPEVPAQIAKPEEGQAETQEPYLPAVLETPQQWFLNPLLYWLLSPLAPLLWIALRKRRKGESMANDQTKVSRKHDSRDL